MSCYGSQEGDIKLTSEGCGQNPGEKERETIPSRMCSKCKVLEAKSPGRVKELKGKSTKGIGEHSTREGCSENRSCWGKTGLLH